MMHKLGVTMVRPNDSGGEFIALAMVLADSPEHAIVLAHRMVEFVRGAAPTGRIMFIIQPGDDLECGLYTREEMRERGYLTIAEAERAHRQTGGLCS